MFVCFNRESQLKMLPGLKNSSFPHVAGHISVLMFCSTVQCNFYERDNVCLFVCFDQEIRSLVCNLNS